MTPHVSIALLRTQSDDRLVKLTTAGHDRAFEAIVDRYRRPLLRYARRFVSEGRAEDVVQAAFVSAWSALGDGVEVRDLRPWLYRIVHNGALNAMKRPGGDDAPLIDMNAAGPGPEAEVEAREDVRRTLDGIAALPDRQRAALVAVAVDGRPHADVAAELGLTDTAVRQLVRRARVSLRAAATAVTPWPAAAWLAGAHHQDQMTARIAEAVAGTAGTAGLASGAVIKTGAIVATVGAIAAGAPQVEHTVHHRRHHHRAPSATATDTTVVHGARAASAATTAAVATGLGTTAPAALHTSVGVGHRRHRSRHHGAAVTFHSGSGSGHGSGDSTPTSTPSPTTRFRHGKDGSWGENDGGRRKRHSWTTSDSGRRSGEHPGGHTRHNGDGGGSDHPGSEDSSTTTTAGDTSGDTRHADDSSGSGGSTGSSGSADGTSGSPDSGGSHDSGSSDPTPPAGDH